MSEELLQIHAAPCCYSFILGAQSTGDLRLISNGTDGHSVGVVEIYMNNRWGTIMFDATKDQRGVGQVICKQLGLDDVSSVFPHV